MHFTVQDRKAMVRYQFATKTADFLICGKCGVYLGAQMRGDARYYAIANLNTMDSDGDSHKGQS